jgi:S1-C subfamily serine protease
LLAVGAFLRAPVADALRAHGAWPLALAGADEAPLQHAATAVADLLHDGAPPATPASTEAAAPAVAALTTPKEVFQARAGGVVIVQVRQPAGGMMKEVMGIEEVEGHGSGFIVDGGLVVTNHHVAGDASSIRVRLKDGRVFDTVSVVLLDPQSDLAVLKVEATGVTAVPIAKAEPSVGDGAIVIGSPLGLDYTLTTGLVSQVREQSATRMLQIDAVVAPGSSGGPVFSSSGDVIGVATAMQGQGLNLAVSSTHVLAALERARAADAPAPRVLAT